MSTYDLVRSIGSSFGTLIYPNGAEDDGGNAQPLTLDPSHALYVASRINSQFSALIPTLLVGSVFESSILDPDEWLSAVSNSGSIVVNNGQVQLNTNTAANGSSSVYSTRLGRFVANNVNTFKAVIRLNETGVANNKKHWGALDNVSGNGFLFEINNSSFNLIVRNNTSDTVIASGSFNGGNNYVLDTNFHTYEIYYAHDAVLFYQDSKLLHKLINASSPFVAEYDLAVYFENVNNSNSTTSTSFYVTVGSISRLGSAKNKSVYQHFNTTSATLTLKSDAGTLNKVMITNPGATGAILTLYDGLDTSGRVIAKINTSAINNELVFGIDFNIGLTISSNSTTVGDITIIYS